MELIDSSSYPDDFRCPISLELMSDPVILTSGHTFDRSSIQRWLDSGNLTCPITKLPLPPHPPLIPNHALRRLISNLTPTNPPKSHPSPPDPNSISYPSNSQTLSSLLILSQKYPSYRRLISDSSAISVLLRHVSSVDFPELQDLSLRILLHLSLDGDAARVGLVADGAVNAVVSAVKSGGPSAALAATVLTSLSVVEVNKCTIGAHPHAIAGLTLMLRNGNGRERREAATALYELCKFPENRKRAVRFGAVGDLVRLAGSGSERAVEVLGLIGKCKEGREEMGKVDGFVRVLAKVLRDGRKPRGVEHSLLVLNLVCSNSEEMGLEVRREGVLDICFSLVEEDVGKIGKNALGLVRTLERVEFGKFCGFV